MTTLMNPDDHRLYQQQYHGYVYMGYSDSRFQILEERQARTVSLAGYTFGIPNFRNLSVHCLPQLLRLCRINHKVSAASAHSWEVGG